MKNRGEEALLPSRARAGKNTSRHVRVIAKLVGARGEVDDVLISSTISTVLSAQERLSLGRIAGTIDAIVRRIEQQ
jgi:hypothetical protein